MLRPNVFLSALILSTTATAFAENSATLPTTVVYADKIHKDWIDTEGTSVDYSADFLSQLGIRSEHDFIALAGGYLGNPTAGQLSLRGLNNDNILGYVGTRSNSIITTLANGVPLSASTTRYFPQTMWGLENASVLKGGQSSSYGPNAMGGVVAYQYAKPQLHNHGKLQAEYGTANTFRGHLSHNLKLDDNSALSLSYQRIASDGFVDNTTTGQDDWEKTDRDIFTLQYLWLSDSNDRELHALVKYDESQSNPFGSVRSFGTFSEQDHKTDENTRTLYPADHWLGSLSYTQEGPNGTRLTNTFGVSTLNVNSLIDLDSSSFLPWFLRNHIDETHFSNDLNIRGELNDHLWSLGAYVQKSNYDLGFRGAGLVGMGIPFTSLISEDVEIAAIYGKFDYRFSTNWSATASLRLNHEERVIDTFAVTALTMPVSANSGTSFTDLLPSLTLAHTPNDETTYGLKLSRNYRSGGVSFAPTLGLHREYAPEYSNDVELYIKSTPSDDLQYSAAIFYSELEDTQVPVNVMGGIPSIDRLVVNSGKGYRWGAELQSQWTPCDSTTVDWNISYVDTHFNQLNLNGANLSGSEFPNAPHLTSSLGLLYNHDSGFYASTRLSWTSSSFTEITSQAATALEERTDISAKFGIKQGKWNTYIFANNLLNDDYAVGRIDASGIGLGTLAKMNQPRTFGMGCSTTW